MFESPGAAVDVACEQCMKGALGKTQVVSVFNDGQVSRHCKNQNMRYAFKKNLIGMGDFSVYSGTRKADIKRRK